MGYDVIYHLFDRSTPVNKNFSNFHNTYQTCLGARIPGRQVPRSIERVNLEKGFTVGK